MCGVAYQEVLDATKHQDDKIGRFMAGIAFLIAGALVFTNSTVLQATYLVGDTSLPLPALALGAFLVLIVLSLLFYLLAMSAPLTIPPAARTTERSRQYFLVIAGETHTTWRRLWTQPASSGELRSELADENVDEIRNLAFCTDLKYERSNEGSALFVLALLFFLLGIVLSIDVVQHLEIPDDPSQATRPPADLDWSLPLRVLVGSLLALFPFALLYQRLRAAQRSTFDDLVRQAKERLRRIGPASGSNVLRRALAKRRWQPLHGLLLAYPIVVLPTILADQGRTRANEVMSVAIGLAAIVAAGCFRAILVPRRAHGTIDPGVAERRGLSWLVMLLAIAAGALAVSAILLDRPVEQLGIGLVVAISPLAANLFAGTIKLNQRLRRHVG